MIQNLRSNGPMISNGNDDEDFQKKWKLETHISVRAKIFKGIRLTFADFCFMWMMIYSKIIYLLKQSVEGQLVMVKVWYKYM